VSRRDASHRQGEQVGSWTLVEYVDSGRTGEVWRAVGSQDQTGALKILYRFGGDRYERFIHEVEVMTSLDSTRLAVLPILDAYVTPKPEKGDPPWFVMPLATRITAALKGRPVAEKVDAIRQITGTLAVLLEEESLHHRDLKPSNLYLCGGRFVVGDFGLAKRPGDFDLAESGKVVGPNAYLPSEVFLNGSDVDWERVDVSVLARTLWQLSAETDGPVRGPILAGGEYSLTRFVADDCMSGLDAVIAAATHETPSQRPSLQEFQQALADWLSGREIARGAAR
jgi:serine/threonine protein kinase